MCFIFSAHEIGTYITKKISKFQISLGTSGSSCKGATACYHEPKGSERSHVVTTLLPIHSFIRFSRRRAPVMEVLLYSSPRPAALGAFNLLAASILPACGFHSPCLRPSFFLLMLSFSLLMLSFSSFAAFILPAYGFHSPCLRPPFSSFAASILPVCDLQSPCLPPPFSLLATPSGLQALAGVSVK